MANENTERVEGGAKANIAGLLTYDGMDSRNNAREQDGRTNGMDSRKNAREQDGRTDGIDELVEAVKLLLLAKEDEKQKNKIAHEAWRVRVEREEALCAIAARTFGWGTPGWGTPSGSSAGQDGEEVRG